MTGLVLALDTAFSRCGVGLFDPSAGRLLAACEPDIGKGHAETLMPLAGEVLAEAGAAYADLSRIVVTVGPGSFTGLRVGVAAARGLALALAVPAVGVTTLRALAAPHLSPDRPVLACLDAKRGALYAALYDAAGAERLAPEAVALDHFAARVGDAAGEGPLGLVGSGAAFAVERLAAARAAANVRDVVVLSSETRVDLARLAALGAAHPVGASPVPLYLRGADAKPAAPGPALASAAAG